MRDQDTKSTLRGVHFPIDICKVTFGDGSSCYAFNSLHWGLGSKVSVRAEKLRWMGSAIRYTTAALLELIRGGTTRAKITTEDADGNIVEFDDEFSLAIANNIITAAKGMKMAPEVHTPETPICCVANLSCRRGLTTD